MNGATSTQRRHERLQTGGATSPARRGTAHQPVYSGTTLPFGKQAQAQVFAAALLTI